jgi:DNA polymerase III epsilon subunit-like protein/predicted RNA-binding Zn-ribbon protein involved in translation (DUF1610 family)
MSKSRTTIVKPAPVKRVDIEHLSSSDFELTEVKTLIFDIETAPHLAHVWGYFDQNVLSFLKRGYPLSISWKWLGDKKIHVKSLRHYPGYKGGDSTAKQLTKEIWDLFNEADIVVAHNGRSFDVKMMNQWFIEHRLGPTTFFHQVDTKIEAKKIGRFPSNKLDQLGDQLGLGRKMKHQGFDLWLGCMAGNDKDWAVMERYNKQDVRLEEDLYLELRPYMTSHPNMALLKGLSFGCTKCGSTKLQKRGTRSTQISVAQRYQCKDCGGYSHTKYTKQIDIRN